LNAEGESVPMVMGSYGIGVGRVMAAAVEVSHDADGIIWPPAIAPFATTVLSLGPEKELAALAEEVVEVLSSAGLDVLYDDRDVRAGVKFKDADLIGLPLRVGVGHKHVAEGKVEVKRRGQQAVQTLSLEELRDAAAALGQELL
jgi:prolyl-tRNA synthetase